jgi:uncharacterized membrane protein YtjA (UPF0391 family)
MQRADGERNLTAYAVFARRNRGGNGSIEVSAMLYWAVVFLVIAIIAGVFGFGGIASAASGIAQILFFIFLVIFILSLVMGLMRGRRPPV